MFEPEKVYHIYNRANGNENLFIEERNFHFFLDKYFQHITPIADTFAFCLMPNHFHMMIRIKSENAVMTDPGIGNSQKFENFGKFVSHRFGNLFSSYTQSFNKVYSRTGSLFQPHLKKKEVINDAYFTRLILYIHNNPVKHGFVNNPYDWQFSSIHQLTTVGTSRLKKDEIWDWFGGIAELTSAHKKIEVIRSAFD